MLVKMFTQFDLFEHGLPTGELLFDVESRGSVSKNIWKSFSTVLGFRNIGFSEAGPLFHLHILHFLAFPLTWPESWRHPGLFLCFAIATGILQDAQSFCRQSATHHAGNEQNGCCECKWVPLGAKRTSIKANFLSFHYHLLPALLGMSLFSIFCRMVFSNHFARDDFACFGFDPYVIAKVCLDMLGSLQCCTNPSSKVPKTSVPFCSKNAWVSLPQMNPKLFETYLGMLLFRVTVARRIRRFVDLYTLGWISK